MNKPTVGRVLWYWPTSSDIGLGIVSGGSQPLAATIAHVHSDSLVNLSVSDANGKNHSRTSVQLLQDGAERPDAGFAEWMPYQKGQAAKAEALEKQIATIRDNEIVSRSAHAAIGAIGSSRSTESIEQEIQRKGLTAPRITPDALQANISDCYYFTAAHGAQAAGEEMTILSGFHEQLHLLTFCVLVLKNGFTVTGESACASPENFDAEVGRKIARKNAEEKIWPLMGYELRSQLAAQQ